MPNLTASEARGRFGQALKAAQADPVFISRNGQQVAVLLSFDALRKIIGAGNPVGVRTDVEKLLAASIERRGQVYRALAKLD